MQKSHKLEMAQAILSRDYIIESRSCFLSFGKRLVYVPTGSGLRYRRCNYQLDVHAGLSRLLSSRNAQELKKTIDAIKDKKKAIGNLELAGYVSTDNNFAAVQLLQFSDYQYRTEGDIAYFEGEMAQLVSLLF